MGLGIRFEKQARPAPELSYPSAVGEDRNGEAREVDTGKAIPCNQLENEMNFILAVIATILLFKAIKWANEAGEATEWWFKEQFRKFRNIFRTQDVG